MSTSRRKEHTLTKKLTRQQATKRRRADLQTKHWMEMCRMIADECELDKFTVEEVLVLCQHTPIKKLIKTILLKYLCYGDALTYAKSLEKAANQTSQRSNMKKKNRRIPENGEAKNCEKCEQRNPHQYRAVVVKCYNCNRKLHFAVMCRVKKTHQEESKADVSRRSSEKNLYQIDPLILEK